jgi:hypothetical protein
MLNQRLVSWMALLIWLHKLRELTIVFVPHLVSILCKCCKLHTAYLSLSIQAPYSKTGLQNCTYHFCWVCYGMKFCGPKNWELLEMTWTLWQTCSKEFQWPGRLPRSLPTSAYFSFMPRIISGWNSVCIVAYGLDIWCSCHTSVTSIFSLLFWTAVVKRHLQPFVSWTALVKKMHFKNEHGIIELHKSKATSQVYNSYSLLNQTTTWDNSELMLSDYTILYRS